MSIQEHLNKIRNAIYGREVRESIAKGIETAYDDASEKDNANMEVKIARGTHPNLRSRLDETASQLAQKPNHADVRKSTDVRPINVAEMDTETKQLFTGGAVAVVGEDAVGEENLKTKAVTYDKQDVISVDDDKTMVLKTEKDVSHLIKYEWIDGDAKIWWSSTNPRSIIFPIQRHSKVKIETTGTHNRFAIFTSKFDTYNADGNHNNFKTIFMKNGDATSDGNETYVFNNVDDDYVILGITSGGHTPTVTVFETFEEGSKSRLDNLEQDNLMNFPPLTNMITNGDFSKGLDGWTTVNAVTTVVDGVGKTTATSSGATVRKQIPRVPGHIYYLSMNIKSNSKEVGIDINGDITDAYSSGSGEFERVSTIFKVTSPTTLWLVGLRDKRLTNWDEIQFKDFIVLDLTTIYGAGNEPKLDEMNRINDELLGGYFDGTILDYGNIHKLVDTHEKKLNKLVDTSGSVDVGITKTKDIYPVMYGVKMSNERDVTKGFQETPRPVGWLYYNPETWEILYADGSPENMKYLCHWNKEVTWNGSSMPEHYSPFITKDGDIIFIWRGELLGNSLEINPNGRQNPIIYPAGDWGNPVVVDLGTGIKPTSWLQNSGADYLYNQDVFIFAEYTRVLHGTAHVWKVTKPFTDPSNWKTTMSVELSGSHLEGMKHFHTINYDPFSDMVYATSGDDDTAAKIFSSSDYGGNWDLELEGSKRYARVLNFIFTKDKVYWANDDGGDHGFFSVDRGVGGVPDFTNITTLYDLSGYPPTYVNVLIDDPYGILILNRFDGPSAESLDVLFWDIKTSTMHTIKEIYGLDTSIPFGFRVEAANFYQSKGDNKIVVGFGRPQNNMALLNNTAQGYANPLAINKDRINNLVMEVVADGDTFDLKISAISDRR